MFAFLFRSLFSAVDFNCLSANSVDSLSSTYFQKQPENETMKRQ